MKVFLRVDVDVNPRWFRSAVAVAGVPGKEDEARKELERLVSEQVRILLNSSRPVEDAAWDRVRVDGRPVRRVLRRHSAKVI